MNGPAWCFRNKGCVCVNGALGLGTKPNDAEIKTKHKEIGNRKMSWMVSNLGLCIRQTTSSPLCHALLSVNIMNPIIYERKSYVFENK